MTTDYDSPRLAVETTLQNGFTMLPVIWDNTPSPEGEFIRVIDENGEVSTEQILSGSDTVGIGRRASQQNSGVIVFEINVNKNQGRQRSNAIAQELSDLFRLQRINDVDFMNTDINRVGEIGARYQLQLFVFYWRFSQ